MIPMLCHDALVVGGGPAGAALAQKISAAGRSVVLLERNSEARHKVCGEFLSPESLPLLAEMGIEPVALGAQRIHAIRIAAREVLAEAKLPEAGWALTRQVLDEALLARARHAGANVLRGFNVEHVEQCPSWDGCGNWRARITDAEHISMWIRGREAFLATGKHDLRGWTRPAEGAQSELIALKMYFVLSPREQMRLSGHVELIVYPGGYTGLQPVEGVRANLCALIQRSCFQQLGGRWESLLDYMREHSPHLANRLSGSRQVLARPLALSSIPYGFRASPERSGPAPWRLGDQAAVIPSFCGDGVAIALDTAHRAAEMYLHGGTSSCFQQEIHRRLSRRIQLATNISRLIVAAPWMAHAVRLWPPVLREIFMATRVPGTVAEGARW